VLLRVPKVGDKAKLLKAMKNENSNKGIKKTYKHFPI
jgi:hypothetical protein